MRRSASSLIRVADRQVEAALEDQAERGAPRPDNLRCQQVQARLTPASVRELNVLLNTLLDFVQEHDDPDGSMVSVTIATAPVLRDRGDSSKRN